MVVEVLEGAADWRGLPSYGFEEEPWRVRKTNQIESTVEFDQFLEQAIQGYQDALRLVPAHTKSLMGLAWCYEEKNQMAPAIETYRQAHDAAWREEGSQKSRAYYSITVESGEALLRLLPPDRASERAELEGHIADINKKPPQLPPAALSD